MKNPEGVANSIGACAFLGLSLLLAPTLMSAEPAPPATDAAACRLNIVGESIETLTLTNQAGVAKQLNRPGSSVSLPAGQYRISQVELKGGYRCRAAGTGKNDLFRLVAGKSHQLEVGAPLAPSVQVTRQGRLLKIDYQLLDAAGRSYTGPRATDPPGFTVLKDGREIGAGTFEYG